MAFGAGRQPYLGLDALDCDLVHALHQTLEDPQAPAKVGHF
jgi:hypothetical protein